MEYNAKCPTIFKNAQNSDLCNDFLKKQCLSLKLERLLPSIMNGDI